MKTSVLRSLTFTMLMLPLTSLANDNAFDVSYGYFSIKAKTDKKDTSISNPSAFRFAYHRSISQHFVFSAGYTILMSDFSGKDLGYGIDLGVNYFFLSSAMDQTFKNNDIKVRSYEIYRPYVGAAFYQRQFQATKNSYAGPGLNLGVERYLSEKMNLKTEIRYIQLSGSGESTATELNLFIGVGFKF